MDFNQAPLLVIWEVTRACDLACTSCRASVKPDRHPDELSTQEGFDLFTQVKEFGNPLLVLTGGDPLKRLDLFELIGGSVEQGLRTNVTPSATPLLTTEVIDRFKSCGISRMAICLDGPDAAIHDDFRGTPGSYDCSLLALRHARDIELDTQVQTTITKKNVNHLAEIAELVAEVRSRMWSVVFQVDAADEDLTGEEYEKVFEFLYSISKVAPFEVKTTEAMHYRRYIAQRIKAEHNGRSGSHSIFRSPGVGDGRGFMFISHTGEIYPSGFMPISAGNVRQDSLVDIYRNSSLFRILRDPGQREGKCSYCEFCKVCGGSRARAYALTGNYLAEDPRCVYAPADDRLAVSAAVDH
jgi:radical SAM protein